MSVKAFQGPKRVGISPGRLPNNEWRIKLVKPLSPNFGRKFNLP